MFTIRTEYRTDASGKGKVTAKAHGKQRTVNYNHGASVNVNHASAAGALLNVLADDRQQAKVRHPSGGQRVHMSVIDEGRNWYIDV